MIACLFMICLGRLDEIEHSHVIRIGLPAVVVIDLLQVSVNWLFKEEFLVVQSFNTNLYSQNHQLKTSCLTFNYPKYIILFFRISLVV